MIEDILATIESLDLTDITRVMAACKAARAEKLPAAKERRAELKAELSQLKLRARQPKAEATAEPTPPKKKGKKSRKQH